MPFLSSRVVECTLFVVVVCSFITSTTVFVIKLCIFMHVDRKQIEDVHLVKNDSIHIDVYIYFEEKKRLIKFLTCKP